MRIGSQPASKETAYLFKSPENAMTSHDLARR